MPERPAIAMPDVVGQFQPLPGWLADRLLLDDERVTWVRGPRFNPPWEFYVTHPALFVLALVLALFGLAASRVISGEWGGETVLAGLAAGGMLLASIFVLGVACGYFTRLVVTDSRLLILQGREVCRSWNIDELPRSLVRYAAPGGAEQERAIDLIAVQILLGGSSDKFSEAGKILALGKKLDSIKAGEKSDGFDRKWGPHRTPSDPDA